ncbi:hypothetical protein GCM10017687_62650 [Streptomyces echinatus]
MTGERGGARVAAGTAMAAKARAATVAVTMRTMGSSRCGPPGAGPCITTVSDARADRHPADRYPE